MDAAVEHAGCAAPPGGLHAAVVHGPPRLAVLEQEGAPVGGGRARAQRLVQRALPEAGGGAGGWGGREGWGGEGWGGWGGSE